jgi:hypothetical protein
VHRRVTVGRTAANLSLVWITVLAALGPVLTG